MVHWIYRGVTGYNFQIKLVFLLLLFFFVGGGGGGVGLILNIPVNSYGHVGMVSSPNHTFSLTCLTKRLTSTSLFACILEFASNVRLLFAADYFSRQHFQMHFTWHFKGLSRIFFSVCVCV